MAEDMRKTLQKHISGKDARIGIAVFVADSSYDVEETSAIIATLSDTVWKGLTARH